MATHLLPSRQRVPMLDADTLEDRTRPALDGSASWRLRYFRWTTPADASERKELSERLEPQLAPRRTDRR